jgi:mRNA interferase MazF
MAMIASPKKPGWSLDIPITGTARAGLKAPSKVRMKRFTLDTRLMVKKIGKLTTADKEAVVQALRSFLAV